MLVNNAGICPFHKWHEVTEEIWNLTHETNLRVGFFYTQEDAKLMIEKKIAGRIMAISCFLSAGPVNDICFSSLTTTIIPHGT